MSKNLRQDYALLYPIEGVGRVIDTLSIRRLKIKDQRAIANISDVQERGIKLAQMACGLAPEEMDEMDQADFLAVQEILEGFLS